MCYIQYAAKEEEFFFSSHLETLIILMHPPAHARSIDPPQPGCPSGSYRTGRNRMVSGCMCSSFELLLSTSPYMMAECHCLCICEEQYLVSKTMYCQPTRKILLSSCKFLVLCRGSYFGIFYFCWSRLGCLSWWRLCHPHRSKLSTSALNHQ